MYQLAACNGVIMRMWMFAVLALALVGWQGAALAQGNKVPTIGILALGNPDPSTFLKDFKSKLNGLGYIEDKSLRIEFRSAEGQSARLGPLAHELLAMKIDVLVAYQTPAATAAKAATSDVPIVLASVADPVGTGLVQSLARPGGNITGMSGATAELSAKNLELVKEVVPSARRVAMLANEPDPFHKLLIRTVEEAGARLGFQIDVVLARAGDDFDRHFETMKSSGADGVLVQPSLPLAQVAASAAKSGMPAVSPHSGFIQAGGLMSYSADFATMHQQAAEMVDKVLKGRKPADLPVQVTTKFQLIVNVKAANAIGLKLSPLLLTRADEVIE